MLSGPFFNCETLYYSRGEEWCDVTATDSFYNDVKENSCHVRAPKNTLCPFQTHRDFLN